MTELQKAIERHLGLTFSSEEVTYYQLLDVPIDSDNEAILKALKEAADKWNRSDRKSNPQGAKAVASMLKEAQSTLMHPDKRKEYDLRIGSIVGSKEREACAWDAPFDIAMRLPDYDIRDFGTPESLWSELVTATSLEPFLKDSRVPMVSASVQQVALGGAARSVGSLAGKQTAASPGTDRVALLKKKRQRQQLIMASGLIGVAFLFLGGASIYYYSNQLKLAEANAKSEAERPPAAANPTGADDPFLPGVAPNTNEPGKQTATRPSDFRSNLPSISRDMGGGTTDSAEGMSIEPSMQNGDGMRGAVAGMGADPAVMPDPQGGNVAMESQPMMADTKWSATMTKAREAIARADFEVFKEEIERALLLGKTQEQEAKYKRLDQLGQLYEIGVDAMKEARKSLRGAETLSVGNRKIAIVEVKEDALIVRQSGDNEMFAWNALPLGIALAVSKFTLSETDPTDVAARAVYLSFLPDKTPFHDKAIEGLWEACLGKGSIREDLPQALTDMYE
ncbi:hypothetical protein SH449x_003258 [Pirellulaceae bacterium SH449]